ncbi:hypothetical protein LCGC14_1103610 [marine sediment metagenome]|uniref:HEPN domain-containing protein n=1 Tax=marine sediment metagenome TaxID=412755 RepID=A0A0F9MDC4_9ZZZZ
MQQPEPAPSALTRALRKEYAAIKKASRACGAINYAAYLALEAKYAAQLTDSEHADETAAATRRCLEALAGVLDS